MIGFRVTLIRSFNNHLIIRSMRTLLPSQVTLIRSLVSLLMIRIFSIWSNVELPEGSRLHQLGEKRDAAGLCSTKDQESCDKKRYQQKWGYPMQKKLAKTVLSGNLIQLNKNTFIVDLPTNSMGRIHRFFRFLFARGFCSHIRMALVSYLSPVSSP